MLLVLLALSPLALAQDPQFEDFAKEEELKVEKPDADLSAELGGVLTTGNARFYNVGGGEGPLQRERGVGPRRVRRVVGAAGHRAPGGSHSARIILHVDAKLPSGVVSAGR